MPSNNYVGPFIFRFFSNLNFPQMVRINKSSPGPKNSNFECIKFSHLFKGPFLLVGVPPDLASLAVLVEVGFPIVFVLLAEMYLFKSKFMQMGRVGPPMEHVGS